MMTVSISSVILLVGNHDYKDIQNNSPSKSFQLPRFSVSKTPAMVGTSAKESLQLHIKAVVSSHDFTSS